MGLYVSTPPASEPVTTDEAMAHLRLEPATSAHPDYSYVAGLVAAARRRAEKFTGRSLVTQTLTWKIDAFPCDSEECIELPRGPVASVSSITYLDANGASQTWSTSAYQTSLSGLSARVKPVPAGYWPTTEYGRMEAVTIVYVAGVAVGGVEDDIKAAIKLDVGALYENRESFVTGTIATALPLTAENLLAPYRLPTVLVPDEALAA